MLLVDVSGSTNAQLADGRTVLDVERLTLLLPIVFFIIFMLLYMTYLLLGLG